MLGQFEWVTELLPSLAGQDYMTKAKQNDNNTLKHNQMLKQTCPKTEFFPGSKGTEPVVDYASWIRRLQEVISTFSVPSSLGCCPLL